MNAEIIAVGSELLTPVKIDSNSLYLTGQLNSLGIEVVAKAVIGDDRQRLAGALEAAIASSEVVILTGGLGPTEDDITRDAVSQALNRPMEFHQDICDGIARRFSQMKRKMAEINKRQAYVIKGAEVMANDAGTAPGLWIEIEQGNVLMLLPGPPAELEPMFERCCLPRLARMMPPQVIRTLQFRVTGMPESDLDQLISPVCIKYRNPVTTVLAAPGDIQIHLRARCQSETEVNALLADIGPQIEFLLGDKIYSRNGDPLEVVVGNLLREKQATVAVAESCTGGMLAERITSVPGSSDYFLGGFLVYTDILKQKLLGVDPDIIREHTAVSKQVAGAMAEGARERTSSEFALSITGVAGPDAGAREMPVGTVYIGLDSAQGKRVLRYRFLGDRERIRRLAAQTALDILRRTLQ